MKKKNSAKIALAKDVVISKVRNFFIVDERVRISPSNNLIKDMEIRRDAYCALKEAYEDFKEKEKECRD